MVIFFLVRLASCISPWLISSVLFAFRFPVVRFENFCWESSNGDFGHSDFLQKYRQKQKVLPWLTEHDDVTTITALPWPGSVDCAPTPLTYALCFHPHQWKFSSTPVRTVFTINTREFYHPHRTVRSDTVKRSDLGYWNWNLQKSASSVAYFHVGKRSEVRGTAPWNPP